MGDESIGETRAQKDLLWGLYLDVRAHARHAEMLRSTAVNYILAITSALIALVLSDGSIESADLPLCSAVPVIGLVGLGFVATYTELYQRNRMRSEHVRTFIDGMFFSDTDATLTGLLDTSDERHRSTRLYRWSRQVTGSSHRFWILVPLLVVTVGALLVAIAA